MNAAETARNLIPREIRNWCRSPSHSLHQIWNSLRFQLGKSSKVRISDEWTPRCHPLAEKHFSVFSYDPIQTSEFNSFVLNCPNNIQLLDIGAHFGFFTLAAIHHGGSGSRVLCVEASPSAAKILSANLKLNHFEDNATVLNVAIGAEDGSMQMLSTGPLTGGYFIRPSSHRVDTITVSQRSLTSILEQTGFRPTHIKMDIEGCEFEVIESSRDLLQRIHPVIFLELHGSILRSTGKNPMQVIEILRSIGYTEFQVSDKASTLHYQHPNFDNCRIVCS